MVITPFGAFGPGVSIGEAVAIDEFAAEFGVHGHAGGDADAEASVFFVRCFDGAFGGDEFDVHIDEAAVTVLGEGHRSFFFEQFFAGAVEVVAESDDGSGAVFGFQFLELAMLDGAEMIQALFGFGGVLALHLFLEGGFFRPGVITCDVLMAKA